MQKVNRGLASTREKSVVKELLKDEIIKKEYLKFLDKDNIEHTFCNLILFIKKVSGLDISPIVFFEIDEKEIEKDYKKKAEDAKISHQVKMESLKRTIEYLREEYSGIYVPTSSDIERRKADEEISRRWMEEANESERRRKENKAIEDSWS